MQNEDGSEKIDGNTGIGSSDNRDGHQEPGKDDHGHTVTNDVQGFLPTSKWKAQASE